MYARVFVVLFGVLACGVLWAQSAISDLRVVPIPPWGLAIDYYTVNGVTAGEVNVPLAVTARVQTESHTAENLSRVAVCPNGAYRVYWNMAKDGVTVNVQKGIVKVVSPIYCIVDLSSGPNARKYPVTYLIGEPNRGFNVMDFKTTKLVLKHVEAGMYKMQNYSNVFLSKPFYMGLFEVTQKQWSLVMGENPSKHSGDALPVASVSYDMIRGSSEGAKWPSSNAVDADSFLGKLRMKTGIEFDLPTEAQWEYACRADTTTTYSYGIWANGAYMWYNDNANSQTHEVGTKKPNPWGFYDMLGNICEWCLDWYGNLVYTIDPKGASSGSVRVSRGGCYGCDTGSCTSSSRDYSSPSYKGEHQGFRLVSPLSD